MPSTTPLMERLLGPPPAEEARVLAWVGLRTTAMLGGISSALFALIYAAAGADVAAATTAVASVFFFAMRAFMPARFVEAGLVAMIAFAHVGVVAVAHDLGGMTSPPMFWLPLLLRAMYLAVGRRIAVVGAALFAPAVVVIILTRAPAVVGEDTLDVLRGASAILAVLFAIVGASRQERARDAVKNALARARDDAFATSRLKSELVATVSHELRTPLNAIVGMTGILEETKLDEQQRECTRIVRGAAESLVTLVDDLLETSRLEAGRVTLAPAPFDVVAMAEPVIAMLRPRALQKGLTLTLDAPRDLPRLVGDAARLRQVLTNLVDNAVKFTEKGGVAVVIRIDKDDVTRLRVADTGIGIPKEKLPVIFERFRQADSSTTRRYGGTGLGLAIAKDLIDLMGGTLEVDSRPGEGSTFTASIPLAFATGETLKQQPSLSGTKVLLAEDNVVNQTLAVHLLKSLGCDVDVAKDGNEAVAMATMATGAERSRYDVILMDCHMPELDGYRAAAAIRDRMNGKAPPILALTAAGSADDVQRARDAGMTAHLQKPMDAEGIRAHLGRVVSRSAMR